MKEKTVVFQLYHTSDHSQYILYHARDKGGSLTVAYPSESALHKGIQEEIERARVELTGMSIKIKITGTIPSRENWGNVDPRFFRPLSAEKVQSIQHELEAML